MQVPSSVTESLGWLAFEFTKIQPFIPTYVHLIFSALLPIFAGAHSSLSRPSSAAKSKETKNGKSRGKKSEPEHRRMESLSPSDAIMLPILAGCTLAGLYFLIKWLQDPEILSKILNWYFASFSIFSVANMVSDGLDVIHSLLFPDLFVDRGDLFILDTDKKVYISTSNSNATIRDSPLPGMFSRLPLPNAVRQLAWFFHVLPSKKLLILKGYLHSAFSFNFNMGIHSIEGLAVAFISVFYYNFIDKPWWLTNSMGFGFCYGALNLLSPTTFTTGTLILSALFFYDIYFVFFTPMMVTVATSLDIPIKLVFPRPPDAEAPPGSASLSMLGLGDIVLPGIMIGLALRFDLFTFYLRKQSKIPIEKSAPNSSTASKKSTTEQPLLELTEDKPSLESSGVDSSAAVAKNPVLDKDLQYTIVKADYESVADSWGDRLWTHSIFGKTRFQDQIPGLFPKTYFNASIIGYVAGMLCTLLAMQVSNHAQPALLYLVPSVLVSIWGTGLVRGELQELWNFSDTSEEEEEAKDEKNDQPDNVGTGSAIDKKVEQKEPAKKTDEQRLDAQKPSTDHLIFSFSVAFSPPIESLKVDQSNTSMPSETGGGNWQPSLSTEGHADKRQKTR